MGLSNPRFAGDPHLEQIAAGGALMAFGWFGCAVQRVQIALIDLGFPLPSGPDGDFQTETHEAVQAFQLAFGLLADGVIGPVSMATLDQSAPPVASLVPSLCEPVPVDGGEEPAGTTLLVRVIGPQDEPIDAATVAIVGPEERSGPTNELGAVRFPALVAGRYVVTAGRSGFATEGNTIDVFETTSIIMRLTTRVGTPPTVFELLPVTASSQEIGFIKLPFDLPRRDQIQADTRATATAEADAKIAGLLEQERRRHESETPDITVSSRLTDRQLLLDESTRIEADRSEGAVPITVEEFAVIATITAVIECLA